MKKHPQQPVVLKNGIARFRANAIVKWAVDSGRIDLNEVAILAAHGQFSREDQIQFAQLMGYSVCGAADLSYMDDETIEIADQQAEALLTREPVEVPMTDWDDVQRRLERGLADVATEHQRGQITVMNLEGGDALCEAVVVLEHVETEDYD